MQHGFKDGILREFRNNECVGDTSAKADGSPSEFGECGLWVAEIAQGRVTHRNWTTAFRCSRPGIHHSRVVILRFPIGRGIIRASAGPDDDSNQQQNKRFLHDVHIKVASAAVFFCNACLTVGAVCDRAVIDGQRPRLRLSKYVHNCPCRGHREFDNFIKEATEAVLAVAGSQRY